MGGILERLQWVNQVKQVIHDLKKIMDFHFTHAQLVTTRRSSVYAELDDSSSAELPDELVYR